MRNSSVCLQMKTAKRRDEKKTVQVESERGVWQEKNKKEEKKSSANRAHLVTALRGVLTILCGRCTTIQGRS